MQQIRSRSQLVSDAKSSSTINASLTWCQTIGSNNSSFCNINVPWNTTYDQNHTAAGLSVGLRNAAARSHDDDDDQQVKAHMLWEDGGMNNSVHTNKGFTEMQTDVHKSDKSCKEDSENVVSLMSPTTRGYHFRPATEHDLMSHSIDCASYPYTEPVFVGNRTACGESMVHQNAHGVHHARMVLPLEVTEEPVYVNAKQYHGILRRRQLRAKAELENKVVKNRKPYLHESRHLHAIRRARDGGGRFVNTKKSDNTNTNASGGGECSNSREVKYSDSHGCSGSQPSGLLRQQNMQGRTEYMQWGYEYQHYKVRDWM